MIVKHCNTALSIAFAMTGLAGLHAARAQEAGGGAANTAPNELEEVVVSARKRDERVTDVPDSILVLSTDTLEKANINSLLDVGLMFPNIGSKNDLSATSSFISVRGIAQTRNTEPAVAIVVDGVPATTASQVWQTLFDVKQIEVLKGPQGALYGRNAIAGAFNVVTQRPGNELEGRLTAGAGNGELKEVSGSLSGPIAADKLFFRVAAGYSDSDGTIRGATVDRNVDLRESQTMRAMLLYTPSDMFSADVRFSYDHVDAGNYYYVLTRPIGAPFPGADPDSNSNTFGGSPLSNPISRDFAWIKVTSAKLAWVLPRVTLTSITASTKTYERYGRVGEGYGGNGPGDLDFVAAEQLGNEQTYDIDSWSQEFRVSSNDVGARARWLAGASYLDIRRNDTLPVYVDLNGNGMLADDSPFYPNGTHRNIEAYAVFANIDLDLAENLTLTAALRYDRERRDQLDRDDPDTSVNFQRATFSLAQPKLSLAYKLTPNRLLYLTASRGFRSGGFNSPRSPLPTVFKADELWSYEAGYKGSLADGAVSLTSAVFYEDIKNRQDFLFDVVGAAQVIYNIPKSNVYGVEFDANWRASEYFTVGASLGWMDSEITRFDSGPFFFQPVANSAIVGNKLPTFSHWGATLMGDVNVPINGEWKFVARADVAVRGDNYWNVVNVDKEKDVTLVNASLGIESRQWAASLWSTNLTDERYWSNWFNQQTTALPDIGYPAQRRRFGVRLTYRF
ncbi:MAG: TonB-dependent receptor [Gammaproteobacteria bacterium]